MSGVPATKYSVAGLVVTKLPVVGPFDCQSITVALTVTEPAMFNSRVIGSACAAELTDRKPTIAQPSTTKRFMLISLRVEFVTIRQRIAAPFIAMRLPVGLLTAETSELTKTPMF